MKTIITEEDAALRQDSIYMDELFFKLRNRWKVIAAITISGAAIATAIAFSMTPIFTAQVVLAKVDDTNKAGGLAGQLGGLATLTGLGIGGVNGAADNLGTLQSRKLIENYIRSENLLPILYYKSWDATTSNWRVDVKKPPTLWEATEYFTKNIRTISEDKKSGLITLTVEWKDASVAAHWANDLVSKADAALRDRAIAKSEKNLAYLNDQIEKTSVVELREAIFRLIETEIKNVMLAQGNDEYSFKVIDPAVVAEKKSKPKRSLIMIMGAFFGFLLSCALALWLSSNGKSQKQF